MPAALGVESEQQVRIKPNVNEEVKIHPTELHCNWRTVTFSSFMTIVQNSQIKINIYTGKGKREIFIKKCETRVFNLKILSSSGVSSLWQIWNLLQKLKRHDFLSHIRYNIYWLISILKLIYYMNNPYTRRTSNTTVLTSLWHSAAPIYCKTSIQR